MTASFENKKIAQAWLYAFIANTAPPDNVGWDVVKSLAIFKQCQQHVTPDMMPKLCSKMFNFYSSFHNDWPYASEVTTEVFNLFPAEFLQWQKRRLDDNMLFQPLAEELALFHQLGFMPAEPPSLFSDTSLNKYQNFFTKHQGFGELLYKVRDTEPWQKIVPWLIERLLKEGAKKELEAAPHERPSKFGLADTLNTLQSFWSDKKLPRMITRALKECTAGHLKDVPVVIYTKMVKQQHAQGGKDQHVVPVVTALLNVCCNRLENLSNSITFAELDLAVNMTKCINHLKKTDTHTLALPLDTITDRVVKSVSNLCKKSSAAGALLSYDAPCELLADYRKIHTLPWLTASFLDAAYASQVQNNNNSLAIFSLLTPDTAVERILARLDDTCSSSIRDNSTKSSSALTSFLPQLLSWFAANSNSDFIVQLKTRVADNDVFKRAMLRFLAIKENDLPGKYRADALHPSWGAPEPSPLLVELQALYPDEQARWDELSCLQYIHREVFKEAAFAEVLDMYTGNRTPTLTNLYAMVETMKGALDLSVTVDTIVGNMLRPKLELDKHALMQDVQFPDTSLGL